MACCKPPLSLQTEEMRKGDSLDLSPLSFYRQNIRWKKWYNREPGITFIVVF